MPSTIKRKRNIPWKAKKRIAQQHAKYDIDDFYHSVVWRKTRNAYFNLHPLCKYCYECDRINKPAYVVDHIVGIKFGGDELDEHNLQSLCSYHHSVKSGFEAHQKCDPCTSKLYPLHPLN